jgi:hypothetical protein
MCSLYQTCLFLMVPRACLFPIFEGARRLARRFVVADHFLLQESSHLTGRREAPMPLPISRTPIPAVCRATNRSFAIRFGQRNVGKSGYR